MKINQWTLGLAAVGLVSLPAGVMADEKANNILTSLSSTTISGYINTSVHWNLGTGNANNPGYSFGGGKSDGFNLDVVKLSIEKPLDESQWAAGYKVDLLFGPDGNALATTSTGVATSDFAIKQAYVALRAPVGNGLDFKVGVWDTIIGFESFDAGNNPNYTRSYGYTIEPTTHTGILSTYQFNEVISASVGVANTFGSGINARAVPAKAESYKTYMGSLSFTAPKSAGWAEGSQLTAVVINGFNASVGADQTSFYVGGTLATPVKGFKVGASYDYRGVSAQPNLGATSGYQNATALYASFAIPDSKLTLHARGEYFSQTPSIAGPGLPRAILAYTGTVQYDLWANVLSRLEFRWDHQASGGPRAFGGTVPGTGTRRNAYLVAANLIYKF